MKEMNGDRQSEGALGSNGNADRRFHKVRKWALEPKAIGSMPLIYDKSKQLSSDFLLVEARYPIFLKDFALALSQNGPFKSPTVLHLRIVAWKSSRKTAFKGSTRTFDCPKADVICVPEVRAVFDPFNVCFGCCWAKVARSFSWGALGVPQTVISSILVWCWFVYFPVSCSNEQGLFKYTGYPWFAGLTHGHLDLSFQVVFYLLKTRIIGYIYSANAILTAVLDWFAQVL